MILVNSVYLNFEKQKVFNNLNEQVEPKVCSLYLSGIYGKYKVVREIAVATSRIKKTRKFKKDKHGLLILMHTKYLRLGTTFINS